MTKRKLAILREATRLFAEKGYDATPIAEIARVTGVSEGGIFRHFTTKEDLLFQILKGIRQNFFRGLEIKFKFSPEENGLEMVQRLVRLYCHFYETMEIEFDFIHRNNPYQMPHIGDACRIEIKKIYEKMADLLKIAITLGTKDGTVRSSSIEKSTFLIIGLLTGTVRMRLFETVHMKDLEEQIVNFCTGALQSAGEMHVEQNSGRKQSAPST